MSVQIGDQTFEPSRFYVNKTADGEGVFDRGEVVESLARCGRLRAVYVMTFCLNLRRLRDEMPSLFTGYPVLIVHHNKKDEPMRKVPESMQVRRLVPQMNHKASKGVHHPKSMLLLLTDGIIVVVTTGNFSTALSTDVSWLQFFPWQSTSTPSSFGSRLDDFVAHQARSLGEMPKWLRNLDARYDFSGAAVDLVTTVPGRFSVADDVKYGHLRVRELVGGPSRTVVVQPTSIGDGVDDAFVRQLEASYGTTDLRIVWPDMQLAIDACRSRARHFQRSTDDDDGVPVIVGDVRVSCPLFFSVAAFAVGMDADARALLYRYVPRENGLRMPHCKFVKGDPWLLLTSMCLSKGACGDVGDDYVVYRNFELGVFFRRGCDVPLPFHPPVEPFVRGGRFAFMPYLDTRDNSGELPLYTLQRKFPLLRSDNFCRLPTLPRRRRTTSSHDDVFDRNFFCLEEDDDVERDTACCCSQDSLASSASSLGSLRSSEKKRRRRIFAEMHNAVVT